MASPGRYWLETLGCPKNQVDSDKLAGTLEAAGYAPATSAARADVVVVNTCAFIEAARQESIDTILDLAGRRRVGARLVVTGCLAERYGDELVQALPEVDLVAGFGTALVPPTDPGAPTVRTGTPVPAPTRRTRQAASDGAGPQAGGTAGGFDLLELPRPAATTPWAYVKIAEGCDRNCGFCAIPSFRGPQRSRTAGAILGEIDALGPAVREVVLVAQDLASWGADRTGAGAATRAPGRGRARPIVSLLEQVAARVERVRLLYLYPSALDRALVEAIAATGVPYFDLSLQHVSRPLVRRMRRWGDGDAFLRRIDEIRSVAPDAALRSSFILGYPGETEEDHDALLAFVERAELDWAGFFTWSEEPGTYAAELVARGDVAAGRADAGAVAVPPALALERLRECAETQDAITARRRATLVGETLEVLVDAPGVARSHREAPEIDGVVHVPRRLAPGTIAPVVVTGAAGPDLWARAAGGGAARAAS